MDHERILSAWLVRTSGPLAGTRRLVRGDVTRVGRGPDNEVVIDETSTVSAHHFEIRKENGSYKIHDLNSTNGTFVNGERIDEARLEPSSSIQLGSAGPEFTFVLDDSPAVDLNQTVAVSEPAAASPTSTRMGRAQEELLSKAIARARLARRKGIGDQTILIMREMLHVALYRSVWKFKV